MDVLSHNAEFCYSDFELIRKSNFSPTVTSNAVDTYMNLVKNYIMVLRNEVIDSTKHPNVTKDEIKALKDLSQNDAITIKPADKGGGIVIMGD